MTKRRLPAKRKTSRQKERLKAKRKPHGKMKKTQGEMNNLTAKRKRLKAKRKPHGKKKDSQRSFFDSERTF